MIHHHCRTMSCKQFCRFTLHTKAKAIPFITNKIMTKMRFRCWFHWLEQLNQQLYSIDLTSGCERIFFQFHNKMNFFFFKCLSICGWTIKQNHFHPPHSPAPFNLLNVCISSKHFITFLEIQSGSLIYKNKLNLCVKVWNKFINETFKFPCMTKMTLKNISPNGFHARVRCAAAESISKWMANI